MECDYALFMLEIGNWATYSRLHVEEAGLRKARDTPVVISQPAPPSLGSVSFSLFLGSRVFLRHSLDD